MSLTGMMRTSISGMAAQANRLGTVSDNIANSSTTGYKRASTEFSSLILASGSSDYVPGGVETRIRYGIAQDARFQWIGDFVHPYFSALLLEYAPLRCFMCSK